MLSEKKNFIEPSNSTQEAEVRKSQIWGQSGNLVKPYLKIKLMIMNQNKINDNEQLKKQ